MKSGRRTTESGYAGRRTPEASCRNHRNAVHVIMTAMLTSPPKAHNLPTCPPGGCRFRQLFPSLRAYFFPRLRVSSRGTSPLRSLTAESNCVFRLSPVGRVMSIRECATPLVGLGSLVPNRLRQGSGSPHAVPPPAAPTAIATSTAPIRLDARL